MTGILLSLWVRLCYSTFIMRSLRLLILICVALWGWSMPSFGGEYRLNSGDVIRGEPVSFNDDGLVVRLAIGGHSPRISWSKLTQESLQELAKNPQAMRFVEPFIDLPPVPKDKENKKKEIILKPVPRVEQVSNPSFFASFGTQAGLIILLVLYLGNLYAAYQIARYRYRPPGLVCGLAAVFPIIAPAIFLAMPPAPPAEEDGQLLAEPESAGAVGKATTGSLPKVAMASGLSIAQAAEKPAPAAAAAGPQVYKRGEFTFNRRFIETKFPSFFRVVQGEAEKDLVLLVRAGKEEHTAKRISRISATEMHLQLVRGGEVSVPFGEITEIQVRKEGKA
jgi:hypothetical protein